jgi:signal transduction histidine kinase
VTLTFDDKLPRIKGSPGKLQQVFLNLFLNARDAMEKGGALVVQTSAHDGHVLVTVADSGAGIARENLEKIFDPFFTTKGAKKGTGLGLSVSYGIVREHGGNIEVQSEIGSGTRFELSFPEAVVAKRSEGLMIDKAAAAVETAGAVVQAVSTQVVSTQVAQTAVASQNDRLIR